MTETGWSDSVLVRDKWKYDQTCATAFPRIIHLQTHSRCNASCVMCPYPAVAGIVGPQKMPMDLFKKVVRECAEVGGAFEILPFLMNEPTLDRRLPDAIRIAKEGLPASAVSIYTNGSMVDIGQWRAICAAGVDSLVFSCNGIDDASYAKNTGGLSFKRLLRNIECVKTWAETCGGGRCPEIIVHMLRLGRTPSQLLEAMEFWRSRGVKARTAHVQNRGGNVQLTEQEQARSFLGPKRCYWVLSHIHVVAKGDVVLCCSDWRRTVVLGNVRRQSIAEIWSSPGYQAIREAHTTGNRQNMPQLCHQCNVWNSESGSREMEDGPLDTPMSAVSPSE